MNEFMEGVDAFIRGEADTDNPYSNDDPRHKEWLNGWVYQYLISQSLEEEAF